VASGLRLIPDTGRSVRRSTIEIDSSFATWTTATRPGLQIQKGHCCAWPAKSQVIAYSNMPRFSGHTASAGLSGTSNTTACCTRSLLRDTPHKCGTRGPDRNAGVRSDLFSVEQQTDTSCNDTIRNVTHRTVRNVASARTLDISTRLECCYRADVSISCSYREHTATGCGLKYTGPGQWKDVLWRFSKAKTNKSMAVSVLSSTAIYSKPSPSLKRWEMSHRINLVWEGELAAHGSHAPRHIVFRGPRKQV